nr:hypothetical protein [Tanacetum cinerariifolium]
MYCLVVTDDYSMFTYVFFLATKDETSGILKSFIIKIENLVDHKVKVTTCDNRTKFKNREMNQFCEMKADSKLPTTFWAKAVNTACYVQNRVLVVKPHNKTSYELFHGRTPTLSFMRPFGCHVTILNTIDHLGKVDSKADKGFFIGYSLNSKAFRVFNSRTRIVEENLHIRFSESTPNVIGSGPDWLFDIDALTRTMNYEPIVAGTQSNCFVDPKSFNDDGSKPLSDDGKKVDEDPRKENKYVSTLDFSSNDEDDGAVADMNNLDTIIQVSHIPTTRIHKDYPLDQVIRDLQSATQTKKMPKNLEKHGFVSSIQQRTNHKDLQNCLFACFLSQEEPKKTLVDLPNGKRAIGSEWIFRNEKDERGIVIRNKARLVAQGYTKEEEIYYDEVFTHVARIEAIGLFLAYSPFKDFMVYQMDIKSAFLYGKIKEEMNEKDERGIVIRNKARLVAQWYTKEEEIYYDEVFTHVARIEAIGLFLAYSSFKDFMVYQMDIKSAFLYGKIKEEMYVYQPLRFEDPNYPDRVYKVKNHCMDYIKLLELDGKEIVITESSVRRDLQLADEEGNTLQSDEDRLKLDELMALCTNLQNEVLDLEKTKTTQRNEIDSLNRRVKKLEKRNKSRTHKLKRLYKVVLSTRVESSRDEESLEMFDVDDLASEEDKGKGIMIEEPVKPKKKDQIRLDKESALMLQAEFDEEERLARKRAKKEQKANIALIETWDDIQVRIDADHQLAERLQA